jgi:hypothetical protein
MPLNFPNNPTLGQTFNNNNITHTWNGTAWVSAFESSTLVPSTAVTAMEGLGLQRVANQQLLVRSGFAITKTTANVRSITTLTTPITKNFGPWVVGDSQGMLDTGTFGNGTYHIFIISGPALATDVLASINPTNPTLPGSYNSFRRIGSVLVVAGSIVDFTQYGRYYEYKVVQQALVNYAVATTPELIAMPVPTGVNMRIQGVIAPGLPAYNSNQFSILVTSPAQVGNFLSGTNEAGNSGNISGTAYAAYYASGSLLFWYNTVHEISRVTNNLGQLRFVRQGSSYNSANERTAFNVLGYEDITL